MFIQGIKSAFHDMRVIIPLEAAWSVLPGAVIFGHVPSLISERRSKYTYGLAVFDKFDSMIHDEKYKYEDEEEIRCSCLFSKLISIDDSVTVGEYRKAEKYMLTDTCTGLEGDIELYTSESANPKYVDEIRSSFLSYFLVQTYETNISFFRYSILRPIDFAILKLSYGLFVRTAYRYFLTETGFPSFCFG